MRRDRWIGRIALAAVLGVIGIAPVILEHPYYQAQAQEVKRDVPYVPTPESVVAEMLKLAAVTKDDVVCDLGCGDGRIVVTAAKAHGARGVGVDIDPQRIKESNYNAQKAGVTDRVKFIQQDLFTVDLKDATVVTLYLLPEINRRLQPKLLRELRPGARVVSHAFDMGDWKPEKTVKVDGRTVYFWTIPARAAE
jgi:protein-L-isoaspartate O-methyltransferase